MAITADARTIYRTIQRCKRPLSANAKSIKGARVACDALGFFLPATGAATEVTMNAVFLETVDNTGGADGAVSAEIRFFTERVVLLQRNDPGNLLDVTDRERACFQLDNNTVTGDATKAPGGRVFDVTSEGVWVQK